ncbi:DUF6236 family protein [Raoultella ornithinolytica]|uniref:DUF6236 family protein n=1 Tax=Raoultella ornithinolytica TaxID=54291 RepID=UPI001F18ADB3|nr:DUF6236 family protein [Raoultella ornithinolytica]MCF6709474.1 hypothetical protein [Raoultella ornithinolytica]
MKRGIVTAPAILAETNEGFRVIRYINQEEINYFVLYWDKITMPRLLIDFAIENEDELIRCGVLSRFNYMADITGATSVPKLSLESQFSLVEHLRRVEPGSDWRIHQIGDKNLQPIKNSMQTPAREVIRLELLGLLPVPGVSVHLHDILEFKTRRHPELAALHSYCDDLYLEVLNSADPNLQRAINFSKLKGAVDDLNKLNKQEWQSPIKFNLDISPEFDISNIRAGYAALLGAIQSPAPITTAILGGALSVAEGFVKLKVEFRSLRKTNGVNHMMYLSNARREGVI